MDHFHILMEPFTIENDLLTPTYKVKRNAVADKFKAELQALYG